MSVVQQPRSVFIPSIHRKVDETGLVALFSGFGEVVRVDFFEINPPKKEWRRAAVYFPEEAWEKVSEYLTASEVSDENSVSYQVEDKTYKATMITNKNPVPFTDQNIHQLAYAIQQNYEASVNTAAWIEYLSAENKKKDERIDHLERKINLMPLPLVRQTAWTRPDLEEGEIDERTSPFELVV
jgi:hypothetical protein